MVGEVGLEPTKPLAAVFQSAPFAARDTPPLMPKSAPKRGLRSLRPHSPLVTPKTGGQRHVGTPAKRGRSGSRLRRAHIGELRRAVNRWLTRDYRRGRWAAPWPSTHTFNSLARLKESA